MVLFLTTFYKTIFERHQKYFSLDDIEKRLSFENILVISLFDCCREFVSKGISAESKGSNHVFYACPEGDFAPRGKGCLSPITEQWLLHLYGHPNAQYPLILKEFNNESVTNYV